MPQVLHRAINHPKPLPRGAWWAPVGRWLLPCPSRSSEASPIAFWAMALGCRLALLTLIPFVRTTSHHNHTPEPRYDWQSVCTKAWWCALGPATPPCRTGRAILRERRMPLSYKRFVLASPATT